MIAKIALDHRALESPPQPELGDRASARRLAETILTFGRIMRTGEKDLAEFEQAVRALSNHLGVDFWGPVLRAMNDQGLPVCRLEPQMSKSTGDLCADGTMLELEGLVDLIVAGERAQRSPNLSSDQIVALYERDGFTRLHDSLEVALPDAIDQCSTVVRLKKLREAGVIKAQTNREAIREFCAPLAEASTEVNVFDRYLFSGLKKWRRRWGQWEQQDPSAPYLLWLLNSLDKHLPSSAVINLFGLTGEAVDRSKPPGVRTQYTIGDIGACLKGLERWNRPEKLNVFLVDRLDHDRHLRFSCGHAIKADAGFDRLKFDNKGLLTVDFTYGHVDDLQTLNTRVEKEDEARRLGDQWTLASKRKGFRKVPPNNR